MSVATQAGVALMDLPRTMFEGCCGLISRIRAPWHQGHSRLSGQTGQVMKRKTPPPLIGLAYGWLNCPLQNRSCATCEEATASAGPLALKVALLCAHRQLQGTT